MWVANAKRWRYLLRTPGYVGLPGSFLMGEMHCSELSTPEAPVAKNRETRG
jgi:hypothetical protein